MRVPALPSIDADRVATALGRETMCHPITIVCETGSINSDLFAAAKLGADEGAVRATHFLDVLRSR
jgi:hypothetical protein